jgi:hypothetical protein
VLLGVWPALCLDPIDETTTHLLARLAQFAGR